MFIITSKNYSNWLRLAADGIVSVVRENKYGRKFLTLFGNGTFPIKDKLKNMGFSGFKGTWGFPVDKITDSFRKELEALGIDTLPLDAPSQPSVPPENAQEEPNINIPPEKTVELTPAEKELSKMKTGVEMAIKEVPNKRVQSLLAFVNDMIDKVAKMTDDAAQSDFVKNFMHFAAKFHSYSFHNQMLIWVQNPDATYVRGFKQWMELGREVINWDKGITIIVPIFMKKKEPSEVSPEIKDETPRMFFKGDKVYDIADTKPLAGWKESGKKVFEPSSWRTDSNESTEEITSIVNAASDWAKSNNITVNYDKMAKEMGGFSAGGAITINNTYQGINLFSTIIHECAHEVLHWEKTEGTMQRSKESLNISRQEREIDAETTAFIVLQHYGFETKDTPNYLALWKAKGEDVKKRREAISKAVKIIVGGIDKAMSNQKIEETEETEEIEDNKVQAKRNNSMKITISKAQWNMIGKKAGWLQKQAGQPFDADYLIRRAVLSGYLTIDNFDNPQVVQAAEEIADSFSDWPDEQGFGSSDFSSAIQSFIKNAQLPELTPEQRKINQQLAKNMAKLFQ